MKTLYLSSKAYVRVDGQLSEPISIKKGVRQGCPLSPILFNLFLNDIFNKWENMKFLLVINLLWRSLCRWHYAMSSNMISERLLFLVPSDLLLFIKLVLLFSLEGEHSDSVFESLVFVFKLWLFWLLKSCCEILRYTSVKEWSTPTCVIRCTKTYWFVKLLKILCWKLCYLS